MYRAIIATLAVAGLIGAFAAVAVSSHYQGLLDEAQAEQRALRSELSSMAAKAKAPVAPPTEDFAALAKENGDLLLRVAELEKSLAMIKGQLAKADEALAAQYNEEHNAEADPVMESLAGAFDDDGPSEEQRAEWEARRQEFAAIAQQRMADMMAEAIANAKNPREAERLAAMQEHMNHLGTLFGEMRLLETDEEREAYREAIGQTRDTIRNLADQQQRSDLRAVARDFKIPDDQQEAFFEALEAARENPITRSPFLTGGGRGRGGPPGGGGPRGGGGGGRGGQ